MYRFVAPRPQNYIYPAPHASTCTPIRRFDRRVFNAGLDVRRFERLVGRPVPSMRLRSISNPREQNFRQGGPEILGIPAQHHASAATATTAGRTSAIARRVTRART